MIRRHQPDAPRPAAPRCSRRRPDAWSAGAGLGPQLTDAQLRQQFRENFLRGCLSGRTQGVHNQNNYGNCYANSYLARYDGRTLAAITQLSEQAGQTGPTLVDLMMSPERQGCAARS